MKKLLIGLLALASISAFGQSDLQSIRDQNPGASNREVLKLFYNGSSMAAELNDFDKGDNAQSNQECRIVYHTTGDKLNSVVIRQISKSTPSNGPLFPSNFETKLNTTGSHKLIGGKVNDHFNQAYDYITMDDNAYDLIVYQKKNATHDDAPFKVFLRKNGELISFKLLTYKAGTSNGPLFDNNSNEDYGYCWRN